MAYFNCGAQGSYGSRFRSKKALREQLMTDAADEVFFDATAIDAPVGGYRATEVPVGIKLSVVGPDPYNDRKWYATVERKTDGTLKVS